MAVASAGLTIERFLALPEEKPRSNLPTEWLLKSVTKGAARRAAGGTHQAARSCGFAWTGGSCHSRASSNLWRGLARARHFGLPLDSHSS
jgi:hypothetical protein